MQHNERQYTIDSYCEAYFPVLDEVCQISEPPENWKQYFDCNYDSFALTLTVRPNMRIWDDGVKTFVSEASPESQYEHMRRIIGRIPLPSKRAFTLILYEEFTAQGVIHFHGIIQSSKYQITKWCNAYKKATGAFICLKRMKDFLGWAEYCAKDQEDSDPPMWFHISNKDSPHKGD